MNASVGDTIPWHTGRQRECCLRRLGERFCGGWLGARCKDGSVVVGWDHNPSDIGFPRRGDVDRNGCVDDADLLRVLFAFGRRGYRNEDLNWDGIVDDADLLQVLFHFGSGC